MSDVTFLPLLRRGLAQALGSADPLTGPLGRDATVTAFVEAGVGRATRTVRLRGPGDALALGVTQVVRREPAPDATDVEPNYFPLVEVRAPDLPWLLTPAAPGGDDGDRLRPWLVLVTVREQEGVSIGTRPDARTPILQIGPPAVPADELPDLDDSWAWAHVQSLVPPDEVADAVDRGSPDVIARFLSPRRLRPQTRYLACLVPAFTAAGDGTEVTPSWTFPLDAGAIELPAYASWGFATGAAGDFEALCRRLQPDDGGGELGLHALDITDPGLVDAAAHTVLVDMRGALLTAEATPRPWPERDRRAFQDDLVPLLDAGVERVAYDPAVVDPIVAPPVYGAWPAGVTTVPGGGWVRELNADPVNRAAAGLGARIVQRNQEALVAAAWEQAGDLRATVGLLNRGRLAAELQRALGTRAGSLEDADLVRLTTRLQPLLPGGTQSVAEMVGDSAVPGGLLSAGTVRLTRPGTPLARDFTSRAGQAGSRIGALQVAATLAATAAASASSPALTFASHGLPSGAQVVDPTLERESAARPSVRAAPAAYRRHLEDRYGALAARERRRPGPAGPAPRLPGPPKADVSDLARTIRNRLRPADSLRASLVARVPALADVLPGGTPPTTLRLAPQFDDALSWDLIALGAEWLVPGLRGLARNRVRLLEVNPTFVGALMVGANDEIARELVWRGYPVDERATFFHRFWEYADDPDRRDIGDVALDWARRGSLAANVGIETVPMTAIVVRGDLVRRYPTAHWFLQAFDDAGEPVDGDVVEPSFLARLDAQTAAVGFDRSSDEVRAGYFVGVEEQPAAPRFGLDIERPGDFGKRPRGSWDNASWGHLVSSQEELDALTYARASGQRLEGVRLEGATWGRNAAHQARATWQRPFRMLIRPELLI